MRSLYGIAAALAFCLAASGQTQFAVVSIKPSELTTAQKSIYGSADGGFRAENYSLKDLIKIGWDVRGFQITGGPGWLDSARYNVEVKPESPLNLHDPDAIRERRLMVQSMLAGRFHLKVHRQTREADVYFLVVSKGGVRMKRTGDSADIVGTRLGGGNGHLTGLKIEMPVLTGNLAGELGVAVIDKTGLSGVYDFDLKWDPGENAGSPESTTLPSIFTAVQEQLGLRLEPGKGPVDMVVVDSAEKASAN